MNIVCLVKKILGHQSVQTEQEFPMKQPTQTASVYDG